MKNGLVGKILTSILVVLVGINTLVLPVTHAEPPNPQKPFTVEKLLPLAEAGNAGAQNNLGVMYYEGESVPQDNQKAIYWWQKSAEQGNPYAQANLGLMYYKGKSVPQDNQKAVYWYQKSAEQGFADAQDALGAMYALGNGVPQDYQRAYVWTSLAAAQGDENAVELRDALAKELTPAQLTQAQQWARGWHEKINAKKP